MIVKNTIYFLAKTNDVHHLEAFATTISKHFISKYSFVDGVHVQLHMHDWTRIPVSIVEEVVVGGSSGSTGNVGKTHPHPHSFYRAGAQLRTCESFATRRGNGIDMKMSGGIKGFNDEFLPLRSSCS
jgi:urate oxidase